MNESSEIIKVRYETFEVSITKKSVFGNFVVYIRFREYVSRSPNKMVKSEVIVYKEGTSGNFRVMSVNGIEPTNQANNYFKNVKDALIAAGTNKDMASNLNNMYMNTVSMWEKKYTKSKSPTRGRSKKSQTYSNKGVGRKDSTKRKKSKSPPKRKKSKSPPKRKKSKSPPKRKKSKSPPKRRKSKSPSKMGPMEKAYKDIWQQFEKVKFIDNDEKSIKGSLDILGLEDTDKLTINDINKKFKTLILKYHPDKCGSYTEGEKEYCTKIGKMVANAKGVLFNSM
jgi:hypothetical protein